MYSLADMLRLAPPTRALAESDTDGTSVRALLSTLTLPDACIEPGSQATPLGKRDASKPVGHALPSPPLSCAASATLPLP